MNGWEIICVIVGIVFFFAGMCNPKVKEAIVPAIIQNIVTIIVSACLILLPLYFNYWRR